MLFGLTLLSTLAIALGAGLDSGLWKRVSPLPYARADHTVISVMDKMFIIGGCDGAYSCDMDTGRCSCSSVSRELLVYLPALDSYEVYEPMPHPRYRHSSCLWRDTIFVFGGLDDIGNGPAQQVLAYNITRNAWNEYGTIEHHPDAVYPTRLGTDNDCFVRGNFIYVVGGSLSPTQRASIATFAFDPRTRVWHELGGNLRSRRSGQSVGMHRGNPAVFGGSDPSNDCAFFTNIETYNYDRDYWSLVHHESEIAPLGVPLALYTSTSTPSATRSPSSTNSATTQTQTPTQPNIGISSPSASGQSAVSSTSAASSSASFIPDLPPRQFRALSKHNLPRQLEINDMPPPAGANGTYTANGIVIGNFAFVFGPYTRAMNVPYDAGSCADYHVQATSDIYAFNFDGNIWLRLVTKMPDFMTRHAITYANNRIYILGGTGPLTSGRLPPRYQVYSLSIADLYNGSPVNSDPGYVMHPDLHLDNDGCVVGLHGGERKCGPYSTRLVTLLVTIICALALLILLIISCSFYYKKIIRTYKKLGCKDATLYFLFCGWLRHPLPPGSEKQGSSKKRDKYNTSRYPNKNTIAATGKSLPSSKKSNPSYFSGPMHLNTSSVEVLKGPRVHKVRKKRAGPNAHTTTSTYIGDEYATTDEEAQDTLASRENTSDSVGQPKVQSYDVHNRNNTHPVVTRFGTYSTMLSPINTSASYDASNNPTLVSSSPAPNSIHSMYSIDTTVATTNGNTGNTSKAYLINQSSPSRSHSTSELYRNPPSSDRYQQSCLLNYPSNSVGSVGPGTNTNNSKGTINIPTPNETANVSAASSPHKVQITPRSFAVTTHSSATPHLSYPRSLTTDSPSRQYLASSVDDSSSTAAPTTPYLPKRPLPLSISNASNAATLLRPGSISRSAFSDVRGSITRSNSSMAVHSNGPYSSRHHSPLATDTSRSNPYTFPGDGPLTGDSKRTIDGKNSTYVHSPLHISTDSAPAMSPVGTSSRGSIASTVNRSSPFPLVHMNSQSSIRPQTPAGASMDSPSTVQPRSGTLLARGSPLSRPSTRDGNSSVHTAGTTSAVTNSPIPTDASVALSTSAQSIPSPYHSTVTPTSAESSPPVTISTNPSPTIGNTQAPVQTKIGPPQLSVIIDHRDNGNSISFPVAGRSVIQYPSDAQSFGVVATTPPVVTTSKPTGPSQSQDDASVPLTKESGDVTDSQATQNTSDTSSASPSSLDSTPSDGTRDNKDATDIDISAASVTKVTPAISATASTSSASKAHTSTSNNPTSAHNVTPDTAPGAAPDAASNSNEREAKEVETESGDGCLSASMSSQEAGDDFTKRFPILTFPLGTDQQRSFPSPPQSTTTVLNISTLNVASGFAPPDNPRDPTPEADSQASNTANKDKQNDTSRPHGEKETITSATNNASPLAYDPESTSLSSSCNSSTLSSAIHIAEKTKPITVNTVQTSALSYEKPKSGTSTPSVILANTSPTAGATASGTVSTKAQSRPPPPVTSSPPFRPVSPEKDETANMTDDPLSRSSSGDDGGLDRDGTHRANGTDFEPEVVQLLTRTNSVPQAFTPPGSVSYLKDNFVKKLTQRQPTSSK